MDTTALHITGFHDPQRLLCRIMVDEYVALSFSTYENSPGSAYFRIGNRVTALMEVSADLSSNMLNGATLVYFKSFVAWPNIGETTPLSGLPVFSLNWEEVNTGYNKWLDIDRDFCVSFQERELLIAWGDVSNLSGSSIYGRVQFLILNDELIGIRFFDLTEEEANLLATCYPA